MRSYNNSIKRVNSFILLNISIYILSAVCLMVYTTQQSYAHADDEDLGYDINSMNASVTVGTACTFTATVDSEHNANISNGIASDNIGKTTLNTICNDSGGYAVYAIGYTGDEYGATDLTSDISSTYNISTGTNTSGDSSSWAMKLAQEPGTTTATIENGYDNYNIVPDDYTKVATLNTVTDPGSTTSTTGSSVSTTYQTYISPTQPAGTYTGKVKYTLVHPSTAPKPEKPVFMQDTATIKSKLVNYGDTMQAVDKRDSKRYWITKLADGNIWMTQNLDLDIDSAKTYTPADTDVTANWTPARSTTTRTIWDNGVPSGSIEPSSYDPGNLYWDGVISDNYHSTTTMSSGNPHYHIGNYYNWTAAVAMNDSSSYTTQYIDVNSSICPAGWRLPVYSSDKSYQNLVNMQGSTVGTSGNIQNSPTYFVYGFHWIGRNINVGGLGYYWSSTVWDDGESFSLAFSSANNNKFLYPQVRTDRYRGCSVRCVIK